MSWQPIATAPIDGTADFLVFGKDGVFCVSPEHGELWTTRYRDSHTKEFLGLTHWMPMPEPPTSFSR